MRAKALTFAAMRYISLEVSGERHAVDHIRYDLLTQQALRAVVRRVLSDVAQDRQPAGRASFLRHVRHARARREALAAPARAVSGRDDHRAAAPVLGSRGHRGAFRGRAVVQRHLREASRPARRHQGLLRSVGAVRPAVRDRRPRAPRRSRGREARRGGAEARKAAAQAGRRTNRSRRPRSARPARGSSSRPNRAAKVEPAKAEPAKPEPKSGPTPAAAEKPEPDKPSGGAEVVRLDRFRKK